MYQKSCLSKRAQICGFISICLCFLGSNEIQAAAGYYMGVWASDPISCKDKRSPQRIELSQFEILSPSFRCKLLGLREQDKTSFTFMAACNDQSVSWHDEIRIQPDTEKLLMKMKSDGKEITFQRCP